MKQTAAIILITLFNVCIVNAQNLSNGSATRRQIIKKGNVLRKTAKTQNAYRVNHGTLASVAPKHKLNANASRTQPMITKPLIPPQ